MIKLLVRHAVSQRILDAPVPAEDLFAGRAPATSRPDRARGVAARPRRDRRPHGDRTGTCGSRSPPTIVRVQDGKPSWLDRTAVHGIDDRARTAPLPSTTRRCGGRRPSGGRRSRQPGHHYRRFRVRRADGVQQGPRGAARHVPRPVHHADRPRPQRREVPSSGPRSSRPRWARYHRIWLATPFKRQHRRRLEQIAALERGEPLS